MFSLLVTTVLGVFIAGASTGEKERSQTVQPSAINLCSEVTSPQEGYPFNTQFAINKLEEDEYELMVVMDLEEGSYYGSPYSNNSFKGLFNIEIEKNNCFVLEGVLNESPRSKPEYEPFSGENVNWVRESTTYTQTLKLSKTEDFTVPGVVSFVIEPMCNRFEVFFEIRNRSNQLTVLQNNIKIANLE